MPKTAPTRCGTVIRMTESQGERGQLCHSGALEAIEPDHILDPGTGTVTIYQIDSDGDEVCGQWIRADDNATFDVREIA